MKGSLSSQETIFWQKSQALPRRDPLISFLISILLMNRFCLRFKLFFLRLVAICVCILLTLLDSPIYVLTNKYIQELREAVSNIEPKHEKEIVSLIRSYKSLYSEWAFELRYASFGNCLFRCLQFLGRNCWVRPYFMFIYNFCTYPGLVLVSYSTVLDLRRR